MFCILPSINMHENILHLMHLGLYGTGTVKTLEKPVSYTFLLPTGVMTLLLQVISEKKGKMCNSEGLWEFHSYVSSSVTRVSILCSEVSLVTGASWLD